MAASLNLIFSSFRNAAASSALVTDNPSDIRFDIALGSNHFSVPRADRHPFRLKFSFR